jgi:hypothetical protein
MTEKRLHAAWLRPLAGILALVGVLGLTACGGGSGAPNNPYAPGPGTPTALTVLPGTLTVYAGTPATLTISGGVPPYSAFSSDTAVLPISLGASSNTIVLLPAPVGLPTAVTVSVQDSAGTIASAAVTVQPAPLLNGLTVTPNSAACGTNAVCSGQTATASVTVAGPGGGGIANRQVRFDVVSGDFLIQTNNPASPLASTLTVTSDANGLAQIIIKANKDASTQPALLRATETQTGNQVTAQFTIVQTINGAAVLSVVPDNATITSATTTCTSGFRVDYYIYGGTPPYRVTNTFPDGATLVNSTVTTSGGFFEAITNGTCVDPLVFSIFDAAGLQTTATLTNKPATSTTGGTGTPLTVAPPGPVSATAAQCTSSSGFLFTITGGTPPYNVSVTAAPAGAVGAATPSTVTTSGGTTTVTLNGSATVASGAQSVKFTDATTPTPLTTTVTINCP